MLFDDLSLELDAGQLLLLTGHNGAGTSTLLKLLAGLLEPDQGKIQFNSQNSAQRNQAWLGDRNALKLQWTALQNLECLASLRPTNHTDPFKALNYYGLFAVRHQYVSRFSQGMKRRLALASLLLTSAEVWLLAEPQAALDQQGIERFEQMLNQHLHAGGMAVMAAHHAVKLNPQQIQTVQLGSN
jgi:heme exporter protein A